MVFFCERGINMIDIRLINLQDSKIDVDNKQQTHKNTSGLIIFFNSSSSNCDDAN